MVREKSELSVDARQAQFVSLLNASHNQLMGYLISLLGSWHDAEDVLQRASLLMWQKFGAFEPGSDFIAWASTIAYYEARNFQRLSARSRHYFNDDLLATLAAERACELPEQKHRITALGKCLQRIPKRDRDLVRAVYLDAMPIKNLAGRLGLAPQTLYNRLTMIRHALANCVQQHSVEDDG
jgi:RNA polymerase sigma-70 factor (ECF subfamily)